MNEEVAGDDGEEELISIHAINSTEESRIETDVKTEKKKVPTAKIDPKEKPNSEDNKAPKMNFTLEEEKGEAEKSKNTSNMKIQLRPNSSTPPNKTSNSKRKKIIPQKNKITKYAFQQPRFPPISSTTIFKKKNSKTRHKWVTQSCLKP